MEIITESQFFRNIKWVCDGSLLYELTTEENIDREILIYVDKTNILYSSGRRITNQSIVIEGENMDNIFLR